jgi:hypothetical protein
MINLTFNWGSIMAIPVIKIKGFSKLRQVWLKEEPNMMVLFQLVCLREITTAKNLILKKIVCAFQNILL